MPTSALDTVFPTFQFAIFIRSRNELYFVKCYVPSSQGHTISKSREPLNQKGLPWFQFSCFSKTEIVTVGKRTRASRKKFQTTAIK